MIEGQHHHVSPSYLHIYAAHAAWVEDHRRLDNGCLVNRALRLALAQPVSRNWAGYWQRGAARYDTTSERPSASRDLRSGHAYKTDQEPER
jgi:hypothetical protein